MWTRSSRDPIFSNNRTWQSVSSGGYSILVKCGKKRAGSLTATGVLESCCKPAQSIRTDFLHIPSAQKHVPTPSELRDRSFWSQEEVKSYVWDLDIGIPRGDPALVKSRFWSFLLLSSCGSFFELRECFCTRLKVLGTYWMTSDSGRFPGFGALVSLDSPLSTIAVRGVGYLLCVVPVQKRS